MLQKWYYKLIFSVFLVSILVWQFDFTQVLGIIYEMNIFYFSISIFFGLFNIVFSTIRLKYIFSIFNENIKLGKLLEIYLEGNFYNNFLPSQMGGDIYKIFAIKNILTIDNESKGTISTFGIFMDRFSGLLVLLLLSFIGLYLNYGFASLVVAIILLVVGMLIYIISINQLSKKFKILEKFDSAFKVFLKNRKKSINIFISAVLIQAVAILSIYFAFLSIGADVPLTAFILYVPIVTIIGVLPISFNGLGVQDFSYVGIFTNLLAIVTEEVAFAGSITAHLSRFLLSLVGGIIVLVKMLRPQKNK